MANETGDIIFSIMGAVVTTYLVAVFAVTVIHRMRTMRSLAVLNYVMHEMVRRLAPYPTFLLPKPNKYYEEYRAIAYDPKLPPIEAPPGSAKHLYLSTKQKLERGTYSWAIHTRLLENWDEDTRAYLLERTAGERLEPETELPIWAWYSGPNDWHLVTTRQAIWPQNDSKMTTEPNCTIELKDVKDYKWSEGQAVDANPTMPCKVHSKLRVNGHNVCFECLIDGRWFRFERNDGRMMYMPCEPGSLLEILQMVQILESVIREAGECAQ